MSLWELFDFKLCGCTIDKNENWKNPPACCWEWGSLESYTVHSFTQHLSSGSSVTCQAWWQFLSSELVSLFTAPVWTVLLAACPSPLSLDLCRVRLQLSRSVQRVRLASARQPRPAQSCRITAVLMPLAFKPSHTVPALYLAAGDGCDQFCPCPWRAHFENYY